VSDAKPQIDPLIALLESLVPPDGATIEDAYGGSHKLPRMIPAARQIKLKRAVAELVKDEAVLAAVTAVQHRADIELAELIDSVIGAIEEEPVRKLAHAFEEALPFVVASALENARSAGAPAEEDGAEHLFALEVMVEALVPFFGTTALARVLSVMMKPARSP